MYMYIMKAFSPPEQQYIPQPQKFPALPGFLHALILIIQISAVCIRRIALPPIVFKNPVDPPYADLGLLRWCLQPSFLCLLLLCFMVNFQ